MGVLSDLTSVRYRHNSTSLYQFVWLLRTNYLSLLLGQEWHDSVWEPGLLRREKPFHLMVFLTKFQDFGLCDTLLSHGNFAHQRVFGWPLRSMEYRMTPRIPAQTGVCHCGAPDSNPQPHSLRVRSRRLYPLGHPTSL